MEILPLQTRDQRLRRVRSTIREAAVKAGRCLDEIRLLGASKGQSAAAIRELATLGLRDFGENYTDEAAAKRARLADLEITWHFIGRIQSNKTRDIARHFDWVHSVDRAKIARRLSAQRGDDRPPLNLCLQVNVQAEPSKAGVPPEQLGETAHAIAALPGVRLRGLMAIPRACDDFDAQRRPFARLRQLRDALNEQGLSLDTLSMGMSADMEAAILEGATMVRIGTALFGPRAKAG